MSRWTLPLVGVLGIAVGAVGMIWWSANDSLALTDRARVERVVHDYLMAHPEVIPAAIERLQARETGRAVAAQGSAITRPYAGAWTGNPKGDVTVVEYFDYNCGYCRASLPTLRQLVAEDPNVRVVFRELPVLGESSRAAARASLAAAEQDRFAAFHDALYAGGRVTDASIAAAAAATRVDLTRADAARAEAEIARNAQAAGTLGLTGTPSWVIGERVLSGAVPLDELKRAVAVARAG